MTENYWTAADLVTAREIPQGTPDLLDLWTEAQLAAGADGFDDDDFDPDYGWLDEYDEDHGL